MSLNCVKLCKSTFCQKSWHLDEDRGYDALCIVRDCRCLWTRLLLPPPPPQLTYNSFICTVKTLFKNRLFPGLI